MKYQLPKTHNDLTREMCGHGIVSQIKGKASSSYGRLHYAECQQKADKRSYEHRNNKGWDNVQNRKYDFRKNAVTPRAGSIRRTVEEMVMFKMRN